MSDDIKVGDRFQYGTGGMPFEVKYIGNRSVFIEYENGQEGRLSLPSMGNYEKVIPFFEAGNVYCDGTYCLAVKSVWSEGNKRYASGWEWKVTQDRSRGWGYLTESMDPNGAPYEFRRVDDDS